MAFDPEQEAYQKAMGVIAAKYVERQKQDLKAVMSTVEGRRVMARIFALTNFREDIPVDNASKRDWLLGKRSVAVGLFREMKNPDIYPLYQKMEQDDVEQQNFDEAEGKKLVAQYQKRS